MHLLALKLDILNTSYEQSQFITSVIKIVDTIFLLFLGLVLLSVVDPLRPRDLCEEVLVRLLPEDTRDSLRVCMVDSTSGLVTGTTASCS